MEVKVYSSIAEVDEAKWNVIVEKNRLICTHKYIEAVEKSNINDCRFFYPVVYDEGEIIAHATCYYISTELDAFAQGVVKNMVSLIRRRWKGFFILRTLECGTPVAAGNTISFRKDVDRVAILDLLCREIERLAGELRVKVVLFRDFYDEELELFDYFTLVGYTKIHNLPSTKIEIRWKNFDEYLDSMRSQYKYKIIKRMKKCKKDINIQLVKDFSGYKNELEKLWMNVYNNAKEYKRERLTTVFFENMDKYLQDRSAIILAKRNSVSVGFALLLYDNKILIPLFFGLDYAYNEEYCVYFNLMYKAIEVGINEGMKSIDMGITTLIPKKDIGCVITPLNMYMKHLNPFLNKVVPKTFAMMTPQDNSGPRRVFKASGQNEEEDKNILRTTKSQPGHVFIGAE